MWTGFIWLTYVRNQ